MTAKYVRCSEADIPAAARWCVPRRNQGQTVEVAYASPGRRDEADHGDEYRRTTDRSTGTVTYERRSDVGVQ